MKMNKKKHRIYFCLVVMLLFAVSSPVVIGLYLDDLEDVIIVTPPYNNQLLQYNSTSGNWTNVNYSAIGDGYAGSTGHPHNQDLNTTNNVTFYNITADGNILIPTLSNRLWFDASTSIYRSPFNLTLSADEIAMDCANGTAFILDENGIITTRFQSGARARLSAGQSIPRNVWTKLLLTVEDFDNNNDFDIINNRFVAPVMGIYQISYSVYVFEVVNGDVLGSAIYKNSVIAGGYELSQATTVGVIDCSNSGADILLLNIGDYIELFVFHTSAIGNRIFPQMVDSNYLAIHKIG